LTLRIEGSTSAEKNNDSSTEGKNSMFKVILDAFEEALSCKKLQLNFDSGMLVLISVHFI
jgi:hypothetical protein